MKQDFILPEIPILLYVAHANVPILEHTRKPLRKGNLIRPVNVSSGSSHCVQSRFLLTPPPIDDWRVPLISYLAFIIDWIIVFHQSFPKYGMQKLCLFTFGMLPLGPLIFLFGPTVHSLVVDLAILLDRKW
ncbi:hypothetical protein T08_4361 [Trichinella sp. T8]|nr:hypothetical protein T08_4361 [Trichinella sp. T8]